MNTKTHTDIKPQHWVMRILPCWIRPFALLMRLDRPIGIWLLLLPGWWAIVLSSGGIMRMNGYDFELMALFAIGAVIMRGAGCVINDIWDRNLDRNVQRTCARPLASGAIKLRTALFFTMFLLFLGLLVLLQMNIITVLLGVLSLPLIIVYPLMKRFMWWPQLFLGLTFNFGALMGWSAVTGVLSWSALLLYAGGVLWTLAYDTVYAHQDKEDDMLIGVKSTALRLGDKSDLFVRAFFIVALILVAISLFLAKGFVWQLLLIFLPAAHFVWQMSRWDMECPTSSLLVFKSNRDFGFLILLSLLL